MKILCFVFLLAFLSLNCNARIEINKDQYDENEFAEFEEDFDSLSEFGKPSSGEDEANNAAEPEIDEAETDEAVVEDELDDNEFEHFNDQEEFEGFEAEKSVGGKKIEPKITIAKVPLHLRTNWESFYLEILMLIGLAVYFLNFLTGKAKNQKLANAWFNSHFNLLDTNFSLVGDDGKKEIENPGLIKESENLYTLWCSGRTCCEGMLVELKFLKRQDLVAVLANMIKPSSDQILIKVHMSSESMEPFVLSVASKRSAVRLVKEMHDLSLYCPERKLGEKYGLNASFSVMSEIGEATTSVIDQKFCAIVNKYPDLVDYLHFSDQYAGIKQPDEQPLTKLPDTKKVILFCLNIPGKGQVTEECMENLKPLFQLLFYCMDKMKRIKLSKEAKQKADKNRAKVEEQFLKTTHAARAEAAQARREEKRRLEKERMLMEEDPEKQRKWEDREHRRQMKKMAPKVKQLKVKAL